MKTLPVLFFVFFIGFSARAQNPVNAYAQVTAITGGTTLAVASVNETYHAFEDGEYVIVMQMQDNVIGTNTTNVSTFGDLGTINSAGLYEVARILSHTESAGLPNSVTFYNPLVNTYNINANASVQLITFRDFGANFTTSVSIGTFTWNGTIGGVTAISVTSVLTVGHNISANCAGFSGGFKNTPNGYSACDNSNYITSIDTYHAGKGEGIYKRTNAAFAGARGHILNGGGGGNDVNGGGGGGGNYSSGGSGGSGWVAAGTGCSPIVGGVSGISLSGSISGNRIFMGGGGGAGHENDGVGTRGAAGGGIILIKAGTLTTISCGGISISATGSTAATANNDGAGGGGAGGSILFNVNTFNVAGACPLTVSSNGGNGGASNTGSGGAHGGGGGGGQGVVIYSAAQPTVNVTTNTLPGTGGVSCGGCAASVNGVAGTGPPNSGIVIASGPLPVELISFDVHVTSSSFVNLTWATAVEKNAKEFRVQRMNAVGSIFEIAGVRSKGSYSQYSLLDQWPEAGTNYYRLIQVDIDGTEYPQQWVAVQVNAEIETIILYPNPLPMSETLSLGYEGSSGTLLVEIMDTESRTLLTSRFNAKGIDHIKLNTSSLASGVYIVKIKIGQTGIYKKLVVAE